MDELQRLITSLMQMLDKSQKEVESLAPTIQQLLTFLEEDLRTIICGSLDQLLNTIQAEATKLTGGSISRWQVVVLISPEGRVTINEIYGDENSDPRLIRLKSEGFLIMAMGVFSSFIQSLKSEVAEGNFVPVIEFLKANTKIETPLIYPGASPFSVVEHPRELSTSSHWKPSDFLPAPFPHPPLPRGLFKH